MSIFLRKKNTLEERIEALEDATGLTPLPYLDLTDPGIKEAIAQEKGEACYFCYDRHAPDYPCYLYDHNGEKTRVIKETLALTCDICNCSPGFWCRLTGNETWKDGALGTSIDHYLHTSRIIAAKKSFGS